MSLRTAMALLGDRDRAADVAQEVALTTVRRLSDLRDPLAFDAWVHRATVRESLRARKRLQRRDAHETDLEATAELAATGSEAASDVAARLTIADRLAALPDRQRSAVILRYVHDLSDHDMATALGCRIGTVHALLSRARAALRRDPVMRELTFVDQGDVQ